MFVFIVICCSICRGSPFKDESMDDGYADDETVPTERLLSVAEAEIADDGDMMEVAETHLFRPLFRYRAQLVKNQRRRINDNEDDDRE